MAVASSTSTFTRPRNNMEKPFLMKGMPLRMAVRMRRGMGRNGRTQK